MTLSTHFGPVFLTLFGPVFLTLFGPAEGGRGRDLLVMPYTAVHLMVVATALIAAFVASFLFPTTTKDTTWM